MRKESAYIWPVLNTSVYTLIGLSFSSFLSFCQIRKKSAYTSCVIRYPTWMVLNMSFNILHRILFSLCQLGRGTCLASFWYILENMDICCFHLVLSMTRQVPQLNIYGPLLKPNMMWRGGAECTLHTPLFDHPWKQFQERNYVLIVLWSFFQLGRVQKLS